MNSPRRIHVLTGDVPLESLLELPLYTEKSLQAEQRGRMSNTSQGVELQPVTR